MTALAFPDTEELADLANWYAANLGQIEALAKELKRVERRLTDYIRDTGPVRTANGLLRIEPAGYDWDDEALALAMPSLIVGETISVSGPKDAIEEVLSTVVTMPSLRYEVARKLDKVVANSIVREGGAAGAAVEACRSPRGKLGLR